MILKYIIILAKQMWLRMHSAVSHIVLSVETHRRVATGNTKIREVARVLARTAPSSMARNSVTRPEVLWKTGRAT